MRLFLLLSDKYDGFLFTFALLELFETMEYLLLCLLKEPFDFFRLIILEEAVDIVEYLLFTEL